MKKTTVTLLLLTACLATSSQAVTWSFDFESLDESTVNWGPESPPVATGAVEYDYEWDLTEVEIRLEGGILPPEGIWSSILTSLPAEIISGSGTENSLPFQLSPIVIGELDVFGFSAILWLGVPDVGMAFGQLNNITFGTIGTDPEYVVTGVRVSGDFTVTPVPEPTTLLLLGLGAVMLRKRRRL